MEAPLSGVETLTVAVMGCIVNGPGESKQADIGISLPGTGEAPAAPVFIDGKKVGDLARPRRGGRVQADGARLYRAAVRAGQYRPQRRGVTQLNRAGCYAALFHSWHQPSGLMSPSTALHALGGSKKLHSAHL